MSTLVRRTFTPIALVTLLASAGVLQAQATTPGTGPSAAGKGSMSQRGNVSSADRRFMMDAAQAGMAEVQEGQVVVQQATGSAVKQFGQQMVDDHGKANDQLKTIAASKGVTLPTTLDAKHSADISKLQKQSGDNFDKAYLKAQIKDHQQVISMFQKEAKSGSDPELKTFAQNTLPTLQNHLQMARSLNSGGMGKDGMKKGSDKMGSETRWAASTAVRAAPNIKVRTE